MLLLPLPLLPLLPLLLIWQQQSVLLLHIRLCVRTHVLVRCFGGVVAQAVALMPRKHT